MTYETNAISHNLKNLNKTLADTLQTNGHDHSILDKQVEILDRLFSAVIDTQISGRLTQQPWQNTESQQWLKLALQCQKQCADTLKSRAAIDYMTGLSLTGAPHPIKMIKQTEGD